MRVQARRNGDALVVTIVDDGKGLSDAVQHGVGLTNVRERLKALYAERGRFTLEHVVPHGARATIEIPYDHQSAR